uniref:Uncharacterized protein n=1 Tax=Daucus carota subsp. sativus TaxID=79200 RepID=A0A161ZQT3_DAUCS
MKTDPTAPKISVKESTKTCMLLEMRSTVLDESKIAEILKVFGVSEDDGWGRRGFGVHHL